MRAMSQAKTMPMPDTTWNCWRILRDVSQQGPRGQGCYDSAVTLFHHSCLFAASGGAALAAANKRECAGVWAAPRCRPADSRCVAPRSVGAQVRVCSAAPVQQTVQANE